MTRITIKKTETVEDGELTSTRYEVAEIRKFLHEDMPWFIAYFTKEQLSALKEELNNREDI